jgi:hypothetical protein
LSAIEKRFDVKITAIPPATPAGEAFAIALARAFGVQLWQAEQIARDVPMVVKRGVTLPIAQKLLALLTSLGAEATILGDLPPPALASPHAPTLLSAPSEQQRPERVPLIIEVPPLNLGIPPPAAASVPSPSSPAAPDAPRPKVPSLPPLALPVPRTAPPAALDLPAVGQSNRPPVGGSAPPEEIPPWLPKGGEIQLDTSAPAAPPVPSPQAGPAAGLLAPSPGGMATASALPMSRAAPLPTSPTSTARSFAITPGVIGIGVLVVGAIGWAVLSRWSSRQADFKLLGNTPLEDSACKERYCLTGVGLDESRHGKRTLVVAWRSECLDPNYRVFLEGLSAAHQDDLEVVGVALTVPDTRDPRAAGMGPTPPPESWPPSSCLVHFDVLAPDHGYASDWLASPVTYMCEADGRVTSIWHGGMTQNQRDRLATWLDGKTWEAK